MPRVSQVPRSALGSPSATMRISSKTFHDIERWIEDVAYSKTLVNRGVELFVQYMAYSVKGAAQGQSMGAVAPGRRSNPALAYRIPVQRITGAYFAGWHLKRVGHAHYIVYNDDRAAFIVEMGIGGRHIPRPILKWSVTKMLRLIQTTRMAEVFGDALLPRRDQRGRFRSFQTRVLFGRMAGPAGRLP